MATCRECHEEEFHTKLGRHSTARIGCENCHGPAAAHVANKDDKAATPPKHRDREFCLGCHGFVASRPNGFPQVDGQKHKPGKRCVSCHDPHDPVPPEDADGLRRLPRTHRAHQGAVDARAARLHRVPPVVAEQHMTEPRSAYPTKPRERDVCAAATTRARRMPPRRSSRVDFGSHGRTYVCWECHYAHLPEGPK